MTMPASKAQQKAVNKYVKANYDLFQIKMPKGKKAEIQSAAAAAGESLNAYINASITQRMGRDASSGPTEAHTALSEAGRLKLRPKGINLDGR
jgi:lipopolysaccharide biosynthesis protein